MMRAYVFVGGPLDGKRCNVDDGDMYHAASQSLGPHVPKNPFRPELARTEPAYVKIIYTKRKCWKGSRGRDFYFAPLSMSDNEALGRYLERPS